MSQLRVNFLNWRPDLEPSSHDGLEVADNAYHDAEGYKQITKNSDASAATLSALAASITSTHIRQIGPTMSPQPLFNKMLARLTNATTAALKVSHSDESANQDLTVTLTRSSGTAISMATAGAILSFQVCELENYVFVAAAASGEESAGTVGSANVTGTMEITSYEAGGAPGRAGDYASHTVTSVTASAMTCATVNQFIVIADADDYSSVRWCAIGDPTDWPTPNTDAARAVQAGSQSMPPELGIVTAIAPGDFYGYIFQERGITKMTYVGGDVVFSFDQLETAGRGCVGYNRMVVADGVIFFESESGYHALNGGQIIDIGHGRVNDSYPPLIDTNFEQQTVAKNEAINCVFFGSQSLCYNYKTDQWTRVPAYDGYPLYSILGADDIIGTVVITHGATDTDAIQGQGGGVAQTATIETSERDINQGGRAQIEGVRPLVNGGAISVSAGVRNDLDDAVTYSTGTAINSRTGMSNFRDAANKAEGRYQRVRLSISGGFTTALGADVEFYPSGNV